MNNYEKMDVQALCNEIDDIAAIITARECDRVAYEGSQADIDAAEIEDRCYQIRSLVESIRVIDDNFGVSAEMERRWAEKDYTAVQAGVVI